MKTTRILGLAAVWLVAAAGAFAQSTPPKTVADLPAPNADVNVTITTSYVRFTNGQTGTVVEATRPITNFWSLGYVGVLVPGAKTDWHLLGGRYDSDFAHLFHKQVPSGSTSKLDLRLIKYYCGAGIGSRRDDLGNDPTFAFGAHCGVAMPTGSLFGAKVLFNVGTGILVAPGQNVKPPRVLKAFTATGNGDALFGVTLKF